jgi:thymidylate synthase
MIQFKELINHVLANGRVKTDRTGTGTTSVFGYQSRFNMADGFPLVTLKKTHTKSIIHELLWFLQGGTNIQPLVKNGVNIWNDWPYAAFKKAFELRGEVFTMPPDDYLNEDGTLLTQDQFVERIKTDDTFAKKWGECGPIYGKQWVAWETRKGSLNQIEATIETLKKTPDSRRIIVTAWRPDQIHEMSLPPCHTLFQFITEPLTNKERYQLATIKMDDKRLPDEMVELFDFQNVPKFRISLQMYQRSCDLLLGVPFNIASYSLLLHMVAQCVNMVPHEFIHTFGDLHIYNNHLEAARTILERDPLKLPTLKLNPQITDIFAFKYEDFEIVDYVSHPHIKLDVAV